MLKISVKNEESGKRLLLEVEGRLAGPWVGELSRCWDGELERTAAAAIVVRLANVSFVDETGTDLLRKMFQAGAKLEGSGCMVRALIAQITGAAFPTEDCKEESQKQVSVQSGVGTKGE
jgi:anti-anti-sigma regulatory factor